MLKVQIVHQESISTLCIYSKQQNGIKSEKKWEKLSLKGGTNSAENSM